MEQVLKILKLFRKYLKKRKFICKNEARNDKRPTLKFSALDMKTCMKQSREQAAGLVV